MNTINKILKYKDQFIGITQGIKMMEDFGELMKKYRSENIIERFELVSYYDLKDDKYYGLNITREELNQVFRKCYCDYIYTKKLKTNKFYNSMFEVLKFELESWYEKIYSEQEIGRIFKVILECFFFVGEKSNLDCCDEVQLIENIKNKFSILYSMDEKDLYVMTLKVCDILYRKKFIIKDKSFFRDTILSFREPLFVLDYKITTIEAPNFFSDIKFSSKYLLLNLNRIIFNYFHSLDLIKKEIMLIWFTNSKKHTKILNDYYNDYNDMDIIKYYNKLEFVEHPLLVDRKFYDCVNYIHEKKNILNTFLLHCVIIGCFEYYNNLNCEFQGWKIPLNDLELDYD